MNIAEKLKDILVEKGLDPIKCTGVTMDNAANMTKAGEVLDAVKDVLIERGPCFCHPLYGASLPGGGEGERHGECEGPYSCDLIDGGASGSKNRSDSSGTGLFKSF